MDQTKQVILAAMILMVLGIAFRACQNSFGHGFIPEELTESFDWDRVAVDTGYLAIRTEMRPESHKIWIVKPSGIDHRTVGRLRRGLYDRGFPTMAKGQGLGFAIEVRVLDYDSLVRAIEGIDEQLVANTKKEASF